MNIFPEARLDSPTPTQIDLQYKKNNLKKPSKSSGLRGWNKRTFGAFA